VGLPPELDGREEWEGNERGKKKRNMKRKWAKKIEGKGGGCPSPRPTCACGRF